MIRVATKMADESVMKILKDNELVDGTKWFVDSFQDWSELDDYLKKFYARQAENSPQMKKFQEMVSKKREKEEKSSK